MDTNERTRDQTPHYSGDGNCNESRGDLESVDIVFQSTSSTQSHTPREVRLTRSHEYKDTSGSTGDSQLLAEELVRAKERVAMLVSKIEELQART